MCYVSRLSNYSLICGNVLSQISLVHHRVIWKLNHSLKDMNVTWKWELRTCGQDSGDKTSSYWEEVNLQNKQMAKQKLCAYSFKIEQYSKNHVMICLQRGCALSASLQYPRGTQVCNMKNTDANNSIPHKSRDLHQTVCIFLYRLSLLWLVSI